MTTKQLQDYNKAKQTGIPVQSNDEPVKLGIRNNLIAPIVPPSIPDEERVMVSGMERPDIIGRDLMGYESKGNQNYTDEAIRAGYGESRFDTRNPYEPGVDLDDVRAREQSWGGKVLNGATKGLVTAGTTFLNTTAGTVIGAFEMSPFGTFVNKNQDVGKTLGERMESSYERAANNPVSDFLVGIQRSSEEILPNYQTAEERTEEYQRQFLRPSHWITGNFIGDQFLKNFGFTAGAMLGGMAWGKLIGAVPSVKFAGDTMKGVAVAAEGDAEAMSVMKNAGAAVQKGVVKANAKAVANEVENAARRSILQPLSRQAPIAIISALGEGSAEGLMARDEFLEEYLPELERRYSEDIDSLPQKLLENPYYVMEVQVPDGNGNYVPNKILNDKGQEALVIERNNLFEKYQQMRQEAYDQGDELAATTMTLNIPILTVSNIVQFSRMLGGGWRSARKAAGQVRGRIKLNGDIPSANYKAGSSVLRAITGIAKVGGAEATEEMLQGTASSGAKQVANDRMTYFNDIKFDPASVDNYRDWLVSMAQGGQDYLGDKKNWQEGFLGALTGLLGMPGKGYFKGERGGVAGAIAEAREETQALKVAADKLNSLVNSQAFRDRWDGYIRHNKFNDDITKAVNRDDEYAFHYADDAMLFSDVMDFAKAGRLEDLERVADRFSSLSTEDIRDIREQIKKESGQEPTELDREIKARVEAQANKIKGTIKNYSEVRDNMMARLPAGASQSIIDETVFTVGQINNFENRFLRLLDETIVAVDPILAAQINKPSSGQEYKNELEALKNKYARIFGGSLVSLDAETRKRDDAELQKLENLVKNDKELEKKVSDMRKLYRDRQKFFDKVMKLETVSEEEFAAQAKSPEKVQAAAEKQAASEEAASFNSLKDVKDEYAKEKKRKLADVGAFINRMRKVKDSNQNVAQFLDIYDGYNDLRNVYTKSNGKIDALTEDIINNVFENARTRADMSNPGRIENYAQYSNRIRSMFDTRKNGASFEDMLNKYRPQMDVSEETYNDAYRKVADSMNQLSGIQSSTSGRQGAKPAPQPEVSSNNTAQSNAKEASQDSSKGPDPSKKKSASIDADGQSAVDSDGRTWVVGETMYGYDESKSGTPIRYTVVGFKSLSNGDIRMIANDGSKDKEFGLVYQTPYLHKELPKGKTDKQESDDVRGESPTPDSLADDAARLATDDTEDLKEGEREQNEVGEKMYYQLGIPEFDVEIAREWRNAKGIDAKKAVIRKIKPFYQEGNSKKAGYKTIWEKLNNTWDAYTNAVKHVEVGDKIKFIANADAGEYNGKPIILMAVEKDGNRYIINVMRRTGNYAGLSDFLNEFDTQYNAFKNNNPGQEFVFEKEAAVWGKRAGIVDYDYSDNYAGEKPITDIPAYDENAPIVWINGNAEFETLRGDTNAARNVVSWRNMSDAERRLGRGSIYYLADNGLGEYVPIRLGIEHFTPENYQNDNPKFNAIRESLTRMEGIAGEFFSRVGAAVSDEEKSKILDEENARLHEEVSELRKLVNLTNGFFGLTFNNKGQPVFFYDRNASRSERAENTKFNGFYLGESGANNISKLVQIFAEENVSLDFYPKRNLRSMIEDGYLTSNAKKLLPKNVDVYITHWNGKDFVATEMQEREIKQEEQPLVESSDNTKEPGGLFRRKAADINEFREEDNGFVFTADELADKPSEIVEEVENPESSSPWASLTEEQRFGLEEYYEMTEEDFNNTSPEDREELLSCIGV